MSIELVDVKKSYKGRTILDGITFSIPKGQRVGLFGANGSGKSTLLKLLAKVIHPSGGTIQLGGKVGALLELGTGFHPELTGKENIFLSGAILGMSRKKVRQSFDQIVDFASVEPFLQTPVKFYSSGMILRLAFSVLAYLDCEILLIDEILATADAQFRSKSFAKIKELSVAGCTFVIVSHDQNLIDTLCDRKLQIQKGKIVERVHEETIPFLL